MSRIKLTVRQKKKNEVKYNKIRTGYNQVKDKNVDISYKQFKKRVEAQMEANPSYTLKEAIKKVQNSETFTTASERSRENFINALKKDFADEYKQIRNLSRTETGKFKKIDLEWTKHGNKWGYSFVGVAALRYFIDVSNSPNEINVYAI